MTKTLFGMMLALCAGIASAQPAADWRGDLWLGRGGHWRNRAAVSVTNVSDAALKDGGVAVRIPALKGTRSAEWRVVGADGTEFEYAVADGETIVLPTNAGPGGGERFFVYWNNPDAWEPIDSWPHPADKTGALRATVGPVETLTLREIGDDAPWTEGDWDFRVAVRVFNFTDEPRANALASVDADEVTRAARSPRVRLLRGGREVKPFRAGSVFNFPVEEVPPRSVVTYWAYVKGTKAAKAGFSGSSSLGSAIPSDQVYVEKVAMGEDDRRTILELVESKANLLKEPTFAEKGANWPMGRAKGARADVVDDDVFGRVSRLVLTADKEQDAWVGRTQRVKVRAGRSYLVGACVRGEAMSGPSTVHFHVEGAGRTSFGSAHNAQFGTFGWTPLFGLARTSADTRSISVHLTTVSTGTIYHAAALVAEVFPCAVGRVEARPVRPDAFEAAQVPSLVKVFRESPVTVGEGTGPSGKMGTAWRISLARNETEELQVAVRSGVSGEVAVRMSEPTDAAGNRLTVESGVVGYVPVDFPTAYYSRDTPERVVRTPNHAKACDGFTGWWPDPVEPGERLSLVANEAGAVRFSVRADAAAAPGVYRAEVTWARDGKVFRRDPVEVEVWNFALPERPSFAATYDVRLYSPLWRAPGEKDKAAARTRVLDAMAKYCICPDEVDGRVRFWKEKDGTVKADFSDYDRKAEEFFGRYRFPNAYMPHDFYCFGWAHSPRKFLGEEPYEGKYPYADVDRGKLRAAYRRTYQQALRLFWDHAKAKGWADKLVLYISDEPHFKLKPVHDQMIALCRMIHEVDPAIRIYSSTWRHCPDWDESLDVWGVGAYGCFPADEMARLAKRGKGIWFTTDGQQCLDTPLCAIERMQGIFCWAYGAEKYEFWGCTWLTADPWKFGWHRFIRQSDAPGKARWVRYPNGDGYHFYPPRDAAKDARPVPSLRVQAIRDGVEEVAYLQALETRAEKGCGEARSLLDAYRALVPMPNAGGRHSTKILPDPERLESLRLRAGRLLSSGR